MIDQLKIFLSSTQVDLSEARENIIRFLGVLKSDLLAMEVFGSDESRPVDFCLKQVRKCNIFIGIYAERYGSIDEETGKSITELEYLEANKMLQVGKLQAMLLYAIDSKANWPLNLIERDFVKMTRLATFKNEILSKHTVSFFKSTDELPFFILRDVIRKIGVASERLFSAKEQKSIKLRTSMDRPIGMEYYGEDLSQMFFGRDVELEALEKQILNYKMSLLIGSSGVGKTSLLYAGLINRVKEMGWQTALIRPLTEPVQNLKRFLWDQLLEGDLPSEFDLSSVVSAAATAHKGKQVIVVIDQFEDILASRDPSDVAVLTTNLLNIFNTAEDNLKVLICYRGDVEPHIGTIWQKISGSPQGLPRTYLGPLEKHNARHVIESTLSVLGINLKESNKYEPPLLETLLEDLGTESLLSGHTGVYPPFIQMVIARIFEDKDENGVYYSKQYYFAGQSRRIIADFLMNQLKYLGKKIEVGKDILIVLVSSYGTKTQKSLEEISMESLLPNTDVENTLNSLIDLRLVRTVNGTYEIAHDFLARIIISELVSSEEREAKKFKNLLASRAAAYQATKADLTKSEHLHIYRFRNKILCTDDEVKLLLASYLSGNGPISYWAKRYSKSRLKSWTRHLLSDSEHEIKQTAYRFLIKLGERPQLSLLAESFSDYKEQNELSRYISDFATTDDIELLIVLNRKKAEEVVAASQTALVQLLSLSDEAVLEKMARSNSRNTMLTFEKVALKLGEALELKSIREGLRSRKLSRRLLSVYALSGKGNSDDLLELQDLLRSNIPQKLRTAVTKGISGLAIRLRNSEVLEDNLRSSNKFTVEKTIEAIDTPSELLSIETLFPLYESYPFLVSKAIYNISTFSDLPKLKDILSKIPLEPPARELIYGLCKFGNEDEFHFLFNLFLDYEGEIRFWNPFAVVNRISDMATTSHLPLLKKVIDTKEFWSYYKKEDRPEPRMPLKNYTNVYFVKRLAGTAFGKMATRKEFPTIYKMLQHDYWIIRNAALEAIRKHGNADDLGKLLEMASGPASGSEGLVEAICTVDEMVNIVNDYA
jgi:hypothetical protein